MGRYLKRNHGTEAPSNLLFFDTESLKPLPLYEAAGERLYLRLWCAIALRLEKGKVTRREVVRGHTPAEFWRFHASREDRSRPLWSFAHNLGHDLTQLHFWDALEAKRFTTGPVPRPPSKKTGKPRKPWTGRMCLEARPQFAVVRGEVGTCKFIDTGNYWPTSLAAIGAAKGLPKLKMPAWDADEEEWFQYCQRDAEVCEVAVLDLMRRWVAEKSGVFQMTAPSLAMTHFQHTFDLRDANGKRVRILCEPNEPHHELERRSYLGGRVEPFYVGVYRQPVHHLDVNGLYLSVMAQEAFPVARIRTQKPQTPRELLQRMSGLGAVADVLINSRIDTYPLRHNGVQIHARGRFWTTLCGPELLRALREGDVESIGDVELYAMANIFGVWAKDWADRKRQAQALGTAGEGEAEFAKLIGLSLNGKWAQKGTFWQDTPDVVCRRSWGPWILHDYDSNVSTTMRGVGGHSQCRIIGREPDHSFPLISAYIAAHGREHMRRIFTELPPRSLLYSATDSLICTNEAMKAISELGLLHANELGKLRHVRSHRYCEVHGPNWYRLDFHTVCAGQHGRSYKNKAGKTVARNWQSLPSIIGTRPDGSVLIREVELTKHDATPKGKRGKDGWVEPYRLSLDPEWTDHPASRRAVG